MADMKPLHQDIVGDEAEEIHEGRAPGGPVPRHMPLAWVMVSAS